MRTLYYLLLLSLLLLGIGCTAAAPRRARRQIDLTVSAEHDDKDDQTELALEAIAGLWSSADSRTKIDGSARVVHRASGMQTGNTSYQARVHLHHDYKTNPYQS
ncbi:hypothetical protein KR222_008992 [Zaprionus bogoriensis]|nr:hypothetical protein KR222_008992 [Zaprionus bogoriensis]